MKKLKLVVLSIFTIINVSCKKQNTCETGLSKGTIIGFDQCTAFSTTVKGYVIKFDNYQDTIVAYFKLPSRITIHDSLYKNFKDDYLFPVDFRDDFKIDAAFRQANSSEYILTLCTPEIMVGSFTTTTKMKQYKIECVK